MRRREFITLLGGAAATWPLAARAQQRSTPVVGVLRPTAAADAGHLVAALRQGLRKSGYPSDKVAIEARWADGVPERLPKLAAELVALQVAAIVASVEAATAAKKITKIVPIVFVTGADPVAAETRVEYQSTGWQCNRRELFDLPLVGKRLALLRELVPTAEIIAVLQDPNFSEFRFERREIETAAKAMGQKIVSVQASREQEVDAAFATMVRAGVGALHVGSGPFIASRRSQLIGLAALHAIPAMYWDSAFVDAGGLISYGANQTDLSARGRLRRAHHNQRRESRRPSRQLPTKYQMVINLRTAKALGLTVPPTLITPTT